MAKKTILTGLASIAPRTRSRARNDAGLMEHKTHRKGKRSICGRNKFPIRLYPTRSSARQHRRTGGVNIDNIPVFHFNPYSNVSGYVHLQSGRWIGRPRTPQQDAAARATVPRAVRRAGGTAFDRARNTVRVSMSGTGGSGVRLYMRLRGRRSFRRPLRFGGRH